MKKTIELIGKTNIINKLVNIRFKEGIPDMHTVIPETFKTITH